MAFGQQLLEEVKTRGKEALDLSIKFNEKDLLEWNRNLILKEIDVQEIEVLTK